MDPDVLMFAQVSAIIVMAVGSFVIIGLVALKVIKGTKAPKAVPMNDARLEQLQQSIDAIAVEVERIAEAQRFSARLLAERNEPTGAQR